LARTRLKRARTQPPTPRPPLGQDLKPTWATRAAMLAVWIAFFLPWCGDYTAYQFATDTKQLRPWLVPALATGILVLTWIPWRRGVTLVIALVVAVLAGTVTYVFTKLGRFRGPGTWVALAAAWLPIAEFTVRAWRRRRKR